MNRRPAAAGTSGPKASTVSTPQSLALPPAGDAVLLVVGLAGVASSGPLIAATAAPALAIAFWRNALGAAVTGAVALARNRTDVRALDRRGWFLCVGAGLFLAVHFGTWVPSLTMTTVATSTALVATQPVSAALIARVRGQRLPGRAWCGIAVAVAATVFVTGLDVGASARAVTGDLLALIGGAAAAFYVSIGAAARTRMTTAVYTTVCYSTCALTLLLACLLGGQRLHGFSADAWLKIVAVTVVAQLLGHTLFNVVLRSTSPTVLSLALLFEVPGAAVIAYVALHQHPKPTLWLGVVLLLAGLALVVSVRTQRDGVPAVGLPDLPAGEPR